MSADRVTPAVVLRTRPLRESDLIVVLLTPGLGKVDCIARGARKSRRRFPGGLPVGARGEATLAGRQRGSLIPLSSFTPTRDHSALGRDLEVFAYVAYLCELSDHLVGGSGADPASFARLIEAIEATMSRAEPGILRRLELGLLEGVGLLPALHRCGVCGSPPHVIDEQVAFSVERGGVLCMVHGRAARRIPLAVIELADEVLASEARMRRACAEAPGPVRRELRDLCRELLAPQLRGPLRSLAFFAQIAR